MSLLLQKMGNQKKSVFLSFILTCILVGSQLLQPKLLEKVLDAILQDNKDAILKLGFTLIGIAIVGLIAGISNTIIGARIARDVSSEIREETFTKIQTFSFSNIERFSAGNLVVRLTNDVTQIQQLTMMVIQNFMRIPILFIGSFILAMFTLPKLWWIIVLLVVLIVVIVLVIFGMMGKHFGMIQKTLDKVNTIAKENLTGIRVVKSFVQEENETERFSVVSDKLAKHTISVGYLFSFMIPTFMFISSMAIVATYYFAAGMAETDIQVVSAVASFMTYLMQIMMAIIIGGMMSMMASRAIVSLGRINEILGTEADITFDEQSDKVITDGTVRFENVSFIYDGDDQPAIENITFEVPHGQSIGIVGATGSGKTTLAQMIGRLYDPTQGAVYIDGINLKDMNKKSLRENVAIVLQRAILFTGTIAENIRQGKENASEEELVRASSIAQAQEFIERQTAGYMEKVEERGANFSGGQKQRLSISRGVIGSPKVLVLDDSTSALDARSEKLVKEALNNELTDTTTFIIAQKISSVVQADKILVLDAGKLVASGTHKELLATNDIYQEIFETQKGKERK